MYVQQQQQTKNLNEDWDENAEYRENIPKFLSRDLSNLLHKIY